MNPFQKGKWYNGSAVKQADNSQEIESSAEDSSLIYTTAERGKQGPS